jgi:hypothetical protein
MSVYLISVLTICSAWVFTPCSLGEIHPSRDNTSLSEVECRVKQADAIVLGIADRISGSWMTTKLPSNIMARIAVHEVLKGSVAQKELDYECKYAPNGYTSSPSVRRLSRNYEVPIECYPYGLRMPAVFFLKRTDNSSTPFCCYLDDSNHTISRSLVTIILTEETTQTNDYLVAIKALLKPTSDKIILEYAIRRIMCSYSSWIDRMNIIQSSGDFIQANPELLGYAIHSVVERLDTLSSNAETRAALQLLNNLTSQYKDQMGLTYAVSELRKVSRIFQHNPDNAIKLKITIIKLRNDHFSNLGRTYVPALEDTVLFKEMGVGN